MKRKLLAMTITLAFALNFCTPQDDCTGMHQNPALCRGTKGPVGMVVKVNNQPRWIASK